MSRLNRRGRAIDGILLVNKPIDISSHDAVKWCKQLYKASKVGHTGSLDPKASGMLPICLGEGTKFGAHLLEADKQYLVEATLGAYSTTGDLEGELFGQCAIPDNLSERLSPAIAKFCGQIEQIPPMHSAVKVDGTPLYKLARLGQTVERKVRRVNINKIELLERTDYSLKLRVNCSKGTYIRTLVEDLGKELGCGAYTTMLHREWVEPFSDLPMHEPQVLDDILERARGNKNEIDSLLLPVDIALRHLPEWHLKDDDQLGILCSGNPVTAAGLEDTETIRTYCPHGMFLGLSYSKQEILKPLRLIARKTDL